MYPRRAQQTTPLARTVGLFTILGMIVGSSIACTDAPQTSSATATEPAPDAIQGTPAQEILEQPLDYAMKNPAAPLDGVVTGGQPSDEDLEMLAERGFRTVVTLRASGEVDEAAEQDKVESLGMRFVSLPISGADDLNEANAEALASILDDSEQQPLLLHCGSSNRVGALVALKAFYSDNASPEDALALGHAAGLGSLESTVRERLGLVDEP